MNITQRSTILKSNIHADYELVKLAIRGNQFAYTKLMKRHHQSVYRKMIQMVNNSNDAEDLTVEAFGKAFRKLKSYTPHHAFSTWLFRIATNNGIDYLRKKRINAISIDAPIFGEGSVDIRQILPTQSKNPEEAFISAQQAEMLRILVNHLPEKYQTIITMRYFQELSYDEIATKVGIPMGTVKAQLFRSKELLQELIQKPGVAAYLESGLN